ncbi:CYCLIN B2-4 [Trifolium repens]|nr:CYCLIN B2-4 [Trifolium repens]
MEVSEDKSSNTNFQGGLDSRKVGQNRRVLGVVNQNLVVEERPYPCVVNKRALSEINEVCEKKQADPGHRPITRRFAAKIVAGTQKSNAEGTTKRSNLGNSNGFADSIFVDDEHKPVGDRPVPMALEQIEPMLVGSDQMEEIEMEDIMEEPINIDTSDADNPLAVTEYIEDLYSFYRKVEVHDKFDLMHETLFLTVNLIDRFLEKQSVVRKKLQLVGLVAMLLACKYEEVSVPVVGDLVGDLIVISDRAYTRKEVLEMEGWILESLITLLLLLNILKIFILNTEKLSPQSACLSTEEISGSEDGSHIFEVIGLLIDTPKKQSDYLSSLLSPLCQQVEAVLRNAKLLSYGESKARLAVIQQIIIAINSFSPIMEGPLRNDGLEIALPSS